ncbi:MAG: hypothetical protein PVJ67_02000 [Candidatus Pacearchaeota archaeon]|jgi:hypothetical protein
MYNPDKDILEKDPVNAIIQKVRGIMTNKRMEIFTEDDYKRYGAISEEILYSMEKVLDNIILDLGDGNVSERFYNELNSLSKEEFYPI